MHKGSSNLEHNEAFFFSKGGAYRERKRSQGTMIEAYRRDIPSRLLHLHREFPIMIGYDPLSSGWTNEFQILLRPSCPLPPMLFTSWVFRSSGGRGIMLCGSRLTRVRRVSSMRTESSSSGRGSTTFRKAASRRTSTCNAPITKRLCGGGAGPGPGKGKSRF